MSIKNYKFHAIIRQDIPEIFWEQAREMNSLWNAMLEMRAQFLEDVKSLYNKKEDISAEELDRLRKSAKDYLENLTEKRLDSIFGKGKEHLEYHSLRETHLKKIRWQMFDHALTDLQRTKEWKSRLAPDAREAVLSRFKTASTTAAKTGASVRFKRTGFIDSINFYHRFSGGGKDTNKLFASGSKKIALGEVDEKFYQSNSNQDRKMRYSNGYFGIGHGDVPLDIGVLLHREMPKGKIKTIQFVGRYSDIIREWEWSFIAAIQTTEEISEIGSYKPAAALDINWRKLEKEYLRIGFIKDTAGNMFEFRLPLMDEPNKKLRTLLKNINRGRAFENKKPLDADDIFITNYYQLAEWSEKLDAAKDSVKFNLKNLFEDANGSGDAPFVKSFQTHYNRIGRRGLLKLRHQLGEAAGENRQDIFDKALLLLDEWQERDHKMRLRVNKAQNYFTNKKKKIYENLALWLKRTYSHLVWEGDLSLKEMAESAPKISLNSDRVAIKKGNKYRQFAGLSVLRSKISEHDETFQNGDNWLIGLKGKNTTLSCKFCGTLCVPTANRVIICPNGHAADQDNQATSNMLEEITDEGFIFDNAKQEVDIPKHLKEYIIPYVVEVR